MSVYFYTLNRDSCFILMSQNGQTSRKEVDKVHSAYHGESVIPDRSDHDATFDHSPEIKNGLRPRKEVKVAPQDVVCSERLDRKEELTVFHGNVHEKSVASITEDNLYMRPWPVVLEPPPPPDPPNPNKQGCILLFK
ncbi:uncharacterized protein LOC127722136 [Mytilus californianus]|uniref:uncharacterized protein LOC127722136 n=1 Tax=Mytilus californianus TaxID=6549 RepID=UPI002246FEF1|nr:uncharacterized protein LOC127722136 [Mytilus californianus]